MTNLLYDPYKERKLGAGLDLTADDIRCVLVDLADYTFSAAHDFLDDVAAAARVDVTAAGLASKTITNGVFDAANDVFAAAAGDPSEAIIIYSHTGGADSARRLICFFDTGITGIPVTPNGGDINLLFNASGIFAT